MRAPNEFQKSTWGDLVSENYVLCFVAYYFEFLFINPHTIFRRGLQEAQGDIPVNMISENLRLGFCAEKAYHRELISNRIEVLVAYLKKNITSSFDRITLFLSNLISGNKREPSGSWINDRMDLRIRFPLVLCKNFNFTHIQQERKPTFLSE